MTEHPISRKPTLISNPEAAFYAVVFKTSLSEHRWWRSTFFLLPGESLSPERRELFFLFTHPQRVHMV